jgi:hypothetical protein
MWFDRPWCGVPVVPEMIVCWSWFHRALVMPAWFHAGVVRSCRAQVSAIHQRAQPAHAPDRFAREIVAFLNVKFGRS